MDDLYVTARFPLKAQHPTPDTPDPTLSLCWLFPLPQAGEQVNHARFIMFFDTQLRDKVPPAALAHEPTPSSQPDGDYVPLQMES